MKSALPWRELVLASGNTGKLRELQAVLEPLGIDLRLQDQSPEFEVDETGSTFVENAIIKARHAARLTGKPALADDSGLIVDALAGQPGVRTARFAGPQATSADNIGLLLKKLHGVPEDQRGAHFASVIVLMRHADDPLPLVASGLWQGRIAGGRAGSGHQTPHLPSRSGRGAFVTPIGKAIMRQRALAITATCRL